MRETIVFLAILLLVACSEGEPGRASRDDTNTPLHPGEERAHIAPSGQSAATMRFGANVSIRLPQGFTVYPGAKVISNVVVERDGKHRVLMVLETADPVERVMAFYRAQAAGADATISLDLGSKERASLGGSLANGGNFSIAARIHTEGTRVEFSAD